MGQRASTLMRRWWPANRRPPQDDPDNNPANRNGRPPLSRADTGGTGEHFFGPHFLMGGKRFEVSKPEAFLFGPNSDLDLLGDPVKFPYGGVSESVSVLNALVNIRKDSIKMVKKEGQESTYRLQFIFDADVSCFVQVHYHAREIVDGDTIKFDVRQPELKPSNKYFFKAGADQVFDQLELDEQQLDPHKTNYTGGFWYPLVVEIRTAERESGFREQAQVTMCVLEKNNAGHVLKPLKQKLITDGVIYMMQEVFGIENRDTDRDRAFECVVCRDSDSDTLLLPCRHLCICKSCDSDFLSNVKECPICRSPVKALLTFNAVRLADCPQSRSSAVIIESVILTEALNGPILHSRAGSRKSIASKTSAKTADVSSKAVPEVFLQTVSENAHEVIEMEELRTTS